MTDQDTNGQVVEESSVIAEMTRPAATSAVPELCDFIASVEKKEGFGEERIAQIETAFRTAIENIITRAYKGRDGEIRIICGHDPWGKLRIVISDDGEAMNILLADVSFPGEEVIGGDEQLKAASRLLKKVVDNIEYKRVSNENVLTFFVSGELRGKR